MNTRELRESWLTGVSVVTGIVVAVAALLLIIIATARSILVHGQRALALAHELVETTRPTWELETTNTVAHDLQVKSRSIEQHASQLADRIEKAG